MEHLMCNLFCPLDEETFMSADRKNDRGSHAKGMTRRRFIQSAAALAAGASLPFRTANAGTRSGNVLPGRIVIWEDLDATNGSNGNLPVVKEMMDSSLKTLTGQPSAVAALESLLPGLDVTKKIAIKINTLFDTNTRWEVVKAITDRLCQMLGGTFPAGNISIYDNTSIYSDGFVADNFPGINLYGYHDPDPNTPVWVGDTYLDLSSHIVNCDYLINCPVLKDHSGHKWTLGFKNHIGSVGPVGCHSYEPRLLTLSASPHIKEKTRLIVLSGLFGVYNWGPGGVPLPWLLFPEDATPNLIMLSTDPVTFEHWGIRVINEERVLQGFTIYPDTYCQHAAESPYDLGVYDFAQHTVLTSLPAPANLTAASVGGGGVLLQWSAVSGASEYRVYRSTDPYFKPDPWSGSNLLAQTTSTSFTDPVGAGDPNVNHYYIVRAYRACWESSNASPVAAFDFDLL
jgi:hypothetical protein